MYLRGAVVRIFVMSVDRKTDRHSDNPLHTHKHIHTCTTPSHLSPASGDISLLVQEPKSVATLENTFALPK